MPTAPPVIQAANRRPVPPTAQLVVLLQSIRSYPCLTLLLNTERRHREGRGRGATAGSAGLGGAAPVRRGVDGVDALLATTERLVSAVTLAPSVWSAEAPRHHLVRSHHVRTTR